jgi:ribosomal protein S12 methylthiotransferase accessory factor
MAFLQGDLYTSPHIYRYKRHLIFGDVLATYECVGITLVKLKIQPFHFVDGLIFNFSSRIESLHLKSSKKYSINDGIDSTRIKPVETTLEEIIPLCKEIGVTRISDITHMDKLKIPNYSAIMPGTEDSIWVYTGKGTTKPAGKASALMEAIERYSSLSANYSKPFIKGSYSQLSESFNRVLHPAEVVEPVNQACNDKDSLIDFLPGFDILKNEAILVPAQLALSRYSAKFPATNAFAYSHTSGLASGNVLEEAICHALCEVVERDAVSIADLCASSIPYSILHKIRRSLKDTANGIHHLADIPENKFVDDPTIYQDVDISEVAEDFEPIKFLVKRFEHVGIPLLIKDISPKDIGLPTFVASSMEWVSHDYGYFAKGYGTHPDARVALTRAISESSQTRAVNIQGARDDLRKIQYEENDEIHKRKWQFMSRSPLNRKNTKEFSKIKTYVNDDILDDIKLILTHLKKSGLKRVIIVDLTNFNLNIPVVRAIVPGMETSEVAKLFMGEESFMGERAKKHFSSFRTR